MTKRKKQCTCHALMAGECVCGAWDDTLAPTEPWLTVREIKKICKQYKKKQLDWYVYVAVRHETVDDILNLLLTAAKKASKR